MVHGEAGRVGNPGICLRATTEVLARSQCKLIVMVGSQGRVDLAIQVRLLQLMPVDHTLTFPLRPLPVLRSEILSIQWSCFSATSKNIATGSTTMSESCVYSQQGALCIFTCFQHIPAVIRYFTGPYHLFLNHIMFLKATVAFTDQNCARGVWGVVGDDWTRSSWLLC